MKKIDHLRHHYCSTLLFIQQHWTKSNGCIYHRYFFQKSLLVSASKCRHKGSYITGTFNPWYSNIPLIYDTSGYCSSRDSWRKLIISDITHARHCYSCTLCDETWSICLDIARVGICEENWSSQTSLLLDIVTCVHYVMKHDLFVWILLE